MIKVLCLAILSCEVQAVSASGHKACILKPTRSFRISLAVKLRSTPYSDMYSQHVIGLFVSSVSLSGICNQVEGMFHHVSYQRYTYSR